MRTGTAFAIVTLMSTLVAAQTLPAPQAVTDPKQISSKQDLKVERNLSIEKLYMTRQVGRPDWSPDGKQIVYVSSPASSSGPSTCSKATAHPPSGGVAPIPPLSWTT